MSQRNKETITEAYILVFLFLSLVTSFLAYDLGKMKAEKIIDGYEEVDIRIEKDTDGFDLIFPYNLKCKVIFD